MKTISYTDALWWLIANDDCSWLDTTPFIMSTTAHLVADIYLSRGSLNEVQRDLKLVDDLRKLRDKRKGKS